MRPSLSILSDGLSLIELLRMLIFFSMKMFIDLNERDVLQRHFTAEARFPCRTADTLMISHRVLTWADHLLQPFHLPYY